MFSYSVGIRTHTYFKLLISIGIILVFTSVHLFINDNIDNVPPAPTENGVVTLNCLIANVLPIQLQILVHLQSVTRRKCLYFLCKHLHHRYI